ncbi:MAG: CoA pyrophosphatase [Chloroflexota bacterium]|nr:CoA pyrophosphatase [Anaerolineae bacterium]
MNEVPYLTLNDVRRALSRPRPELEALLRMATQPRPGGAGLPLGHSPKQGGVLLLLYPIDSYLHLVLTRRTEQVANHKGQISLPGGAREPGDHSLLETALRETREELGIRTDQLQVLGPLTSLYIPPSDYCIQPYVAYADARPDFSPEPTEVEELLEMSLNHLLDPVTREEEIWELRGHPVVVPFYRLGEHKIWGATAMVLSEFEVMLRRSYMGQQQR